MAFKIYTKTGDKGDTGLFGGTRLPKDDFRIEAYGTIDELNAVVGMLADEVDPPAIIDFLRQIQNDLFVIGSHLATVPGKSLHLPELPIEKVGIMEKQMDEWDAQLVPLKNFILPGGHPVISKAHLARCVCRRAERRVISLARKEEVSPDIVIYLNRLSDLFFMLARKLAHDLQVEEIKWEPKV
ncbi:MAG: cob(I)yrinic acid a,c-diamide adenosyltransferase [Saprospiraceae bacterium]|nr:cob(I)yrinic acid a,c-diamide adenosyltransferase [Saprospiraceae bacterium]